MGKYCLHFHHAGQCADCVFMGNSIYKSAQVGITVHATHRSLVDSNILWDTAAAGIYVEDGNEMFNTLSLSLAFGYYNSLSNYFMIYINGSNMTYIYN